MSNHELVDYDECECPRCDKPAMTGSPWGLDYCSKECREKHSEMLKDETERERIAEITSGGQV